VKSLINAILVVVLALTFVSAGFAEIVVLFDEDTKDEGGKGAFVPLFISHDAGSTVTVTKDEAISGKSSAFCTPSQSYNPNMAGWGYSIDDYPFMSFAWKKDGGTGIMIQMAYNGTWAYRYFSGVNVTNWPGIQLEEDIPEDWMIYTRDLTQDFAKGWNLTGLALTPWDGAGGYYDHIILHTKESEGKIAGNPVEAKGKLATVWGNIKQD